MAVYTDNTPEHEHIKLKGAYEVDPEYHKDPSMRVVPLAVKNYFVYGIPVEDTIYKHNDIFDFCLRLKTNSKSQPKYRECKVIGEIKETLLDRTTRYFISNGGGALIKDFDPSDPDEDDMHGTVQNSKKITGVNVGYSVTLFNKYYKKDSIKDYDINYNFYIAESYKLINAIDDKQLTLDLFGEI